MKAKFEMVEGQCPMCGESDLSYGASEIIDNIIRYPYTCSNCDFNGAEDYTLTFAGHIAYDDGVQLLENPKYKHFTETEMKENYKNYIESRTDPQTFSKDDPLLTYKQFAESLEAEQE